MLRENFDAGWKFAKGSPTLMSAFSGGLEYVDVQLPHDAMIHEERTKDTANVAQTGFYPGGTYTYIKKVEAPQEWQDKTVMLEFEGVYEYAEVYVNDERAATNLHGYSGFYVVLDKFLNYGQTNEIKVIVNNIEKNTRWYSGSGIYRDVNLLVGNGVHIKADGVRIDIAQAEADFSAAEIAVDLKNLTRARHTISVKTTLLYKGEPVASDESTVTMFPQAEETMHTRIGVENAKLWNVDTPELYECTVQLFEGETLLDEAKETFGFRKLTLDAQHGLRINGVPVKLRGSCIHHDNGVIGTATYAMAEDRRCRQMKEAGFNSIRSAHHPMSKAMLRACDKYGVLVMDELSDMWTRHKNANDYALHFQEHMDSEIARMVAKDYNHPCVVLYSSGNEIPDVGTAFGAQMNRHICNLFHQLDSSRYTTNAINGMLAAGPKLGVIIGDLMKNAHKQPEAPKEGGEDAGGASELNGMMALMVGPAADALACHPVMTELLKEPSEAMDITGLNYLTGRHVLEKQLHPNKCVLGTETFPADIANLWRIVEENPHVLGDFTWTGYDYLGEAGCGIFYYDGTQNFSGVYPDRAAYIGDINLIGSRRPISYLREIVYGLRKAPYIAVEKVDKYGMKHSQTAWMDKDNIASWTWPGYEGKPARLDVFSADDEVELLLNGTSLGKKPAGPANAYRATYDLTYEPGELVAVAYKAGQETGRCTLQTAEPEVQMQLTCENSQLNANGEDLAFVTVSLLDKNGVLNPYGSKKITVTVQGAGVLQGCGNADPRATIPYDSTEWVTFEGQFMAVVRAGSKPGKITVRFEAEGLEPKETEIEVKA